MYIRLEGHLVGKLWSGYKGSMPISWSVQRAFRGQKLKDAIKNLIRQKGGDFESCKLHFDSDLVFISKSRQVHRSYGSLEKRVTRTVYVSRFPCLRELIEE